MRYVIRTFLGMFLFAFCWVLVGYGIYDMLQIGTCASGGPYVSARQCPDGTVGIFWALTGGIIGLFVAAGIYLTRGKPPGNAPAPNNAGIVIWFWTGLFWSLAIGSFLGIYGPDAEPGPGANVGGLIVGIMGVVMGAGGLLALRFGEFRGRTAKVPFLGVPSQPAAASMGSGRIDALAQLRQDGSLTDDEFEALKNRIARED